MSPPTDLAAIRARLAAEVARDVNADARAAVAAVLRPGDAGAEVLLIRRAEIDGDPWSGQMAFPGGRRDPDDADLVATAIRETREELGLDLGAHGALLGRLDDTPTHRTGLVVSPFVFELRGAHDLAPSPREVAEVIWQPLGPLARGEFDTTYHWEEEGRRWAFPAYDLSGRVVWGLTYRMLQILFELLRKGDP
jgi:8-oxo-dGTP pyrophosphatase MutT (NUDIX family)